MDKQNVHDLVRMASLSYPITDLTYVDHETNISVRYCYCYPSHEEDVSMMAARRVRAIYASSFPRRAIPMFYLLYPLLFPTNQQSKALARTTPRPLTDSDCEFINLVTCSVTN
jgi:hypothetical protein